MAEEIPHFLKTGEGEKQEVPKARNPSNYRSEKREWGWLFLTGAALLALGVVVWGWQRRRGAEPGFSPSPSPISLFTSPPLFSPTPTPSPVPKDKYEVEILNGSGQVGEAGAIREVLEDVGYKIADVGNADSYDYTSCVIKAQLSVEDSFVDELESELKKEFAKVTTERDDDITAKIVVVTGGTRKGVTPSPEATASPSPSLTPEETPEASESAD
jgi:hypothetical protein